MHFEWDSIKATANLRKHGVSIEEASTVFTDMSAREALITCTPMTKIDSTF